MALKIFEFIEDTIFVLEEEREYIEDRALEVEQYFESILKESCEGYININSRVKSKDSLKEKILRNNYYKKDLLPKELIYNLSDLIGIRIECRFIKDEDEIFDIIKRHFNINEKNSIGITLDLIEGQPQKQKNGFKIYRIDGFYEVEGKKIPFELQIKALVNIFWSEIEHKIIYKNNSYMLIDSYLKDIMKSIKKNLMMIDHQLLVTYNQFNTQNVENHYGEKRQIEKLLSKIIYDAYALKMKNGIGFVVDFKKPCDTIMKYFLRGNDTEYSDKMIKTLKRLNDIQGLETRFDEEINFEREINFKTEFSKNIGNKILESINSEFQWNLFFRIIFEIEPGNNAEDFEAFVEFYATSFTENERFNILKEKFGDDKGLTIREDILRIISKCFIDINSIEFVIENMILLINKVINEEVENICNDVSSYDEWIVNNEFYLKIIYIRIIAIFDGTIETGELLKLLNNIQSVSSMFKINPLIFKYSSNLENTKRIKAKDIIKYIFV